MERDAVLKTQLRMNPQTWKAMVDRGVTDQMALRLDFAYAAPGEKEANQLSTFLQRETDYSVSATSAKKGLLSRKVWSVRGSTNETQLSLDTLTRGWNGWCSLAMRTANASSTAGVPNSLASPTRDT